MKYWILSLAVLLSAWTTAPIADLNAGGPAANGEDKTNKIQIALLLDTSNSMDGLIEQAKGKLWSIVNEFARYSRDETPPSLEIALFEYGNDGLDKYEDWIRQITPFTTDLDFISEQLFRLTTYGGSEFCGSVIRDANRKLEWSRRNDDLKLLFIAGNEPFNQGSYSYREACMESTGKDIAVNTIFCGDYETGIRELWKEGAALGKGRYINIDQDEAVSYIETPFDDELDRLNRALNETYIYYGRQGAEKKDNQIKQDRNAAGYSRANAADRTISKASDFYKNSSWDLVDAYEDADEKIDVITRERATLPSELRNKSDREIEEYIQNQQAKRKEVRQTILELDKKRRNYIEKEQQTTGNTLDHAIYKVVESLAAAKGYKKSK